MATNADDLVELIEVPNENEANEYKCWVDLSDEKVRRDIAKHIAALANYGSGYLIFGFSDKCSSLIPDTNIPDNFEKTYTHDYVNGAIVTHYLEPPIHCDVVHLNSPSSGNKHVLIRVPTHGAAPVCLKKGGTSFDGSTNSQVQSDAYYVRKPGPKSEPILKAIEWKPVFQRCVLHERDHFLNIMKELTSMLQSVTPPGEPAAPKITYASGTNCEACRRCFYG